MDYFRISAEYAYKQSLEILQLRDYLIALILFLVVWQIGKTNHKNAGYFAALVAYVYLVVMFAVFGRDEISNPTVELMPFWSYIQISKGQQILLLENFLNVVMFVPLGYLLGKLNCRLANVLLSGLCMSYFIEFSQLVLHKGLFELFDDPFHNVLGTLVGYILFKSIRKLRKFINKFFVIQMGGKRPSGL